MNGGKGLVWSGPGPVFQKGSEVAVGDTSEHGCCETCFPLLLIVVEWLKSKFTKLLKFEKCCSPSQVNQEIWLFRRFGGSKTCTKMAPW